eukprot:3173180-Pleurochrysis_carterae.AAC.1
MPAPYIILSSLRHSRRVAPACDKTLKRLSAALARKGKGKGEGAGKKSVGLFAWFKYCLKNRKTDPEMAGLEIAAAEEKLLMRWDSVPFSGFIVDSIIASVAPEAAESGQVLGKAPEQNREKPPEAGSCT